jgi:hypothetical protein
MILTSKYFLNEILDLNYIHILNDEPLLRRSEVQFELHVTYCVWDLQMVPVTCRQYHPDIAHSQNLYVLQLYQLHGTLLGRKY